MNRKKYKSYTRAVVAAVNDYFGREYEKEEDPYLETREKEDAFLRQVQNAIKEGVKESVPMLLAKNLMELLYPYMNGVGQPFMQEKEEAGFAFDSVDREQEENADLALDFADRKKNKKEQKNCPERESGQNLLISILFTGVGALVICQFKQIINAGFMKFGQFDQDLCGNVYIATFIITVNTLTAI